VGSEQGTDFRISIWGVKWRQTRRTLSRFNLDSAVRLASFALLLGIFAGVCFLGIQQLCTKLLAIHVVGPLIIERALSLGLLTLFFLVALSQMVTSYARLFRSNDLFLLQRAPLPSRALFSPQATETLLKGSWIVTLFTLIILVAYGHGRQASWAHFSLSLIGAIPFLLIASTLGMLLMLLLAWLVIGRKLRERLFLIGGVLFLCLLVFRGRFTVSWFAADAPIRKLGESLANLRISRNPYLPSYWLSDLVRACVERRLTDAVHNLVLLGTTAWLLLSLTWALGGRVYRSAWLWCRDRSLSRRKGAPRGRKMWFGFPLSLVPSWFRSLLVKEWFIFRRDFSQWGQFLLIIGLVLLYVIQVRDIAVEDVTPQMRSIIAFLNILLLGFIQATLALRYAFPSVSLEGNAFWAVRTSPISTRRYFFGKYLYHFLWILALGEIIIALLSQILILDSLLYSLAFVIVGLLSLGFTSCTVGLGALYPRFDAPSSADISSSGGALVSMILTLSYLAFSAAILARLFLNFLPMIGQSHVGNRGVGGLLMLAGGFICSCLQILLPEGGELWLTEYLPLDAVWGIVDINSTILITLFLLFQGVAICCPVEAGIRRLEEIGG